MSCLYPQPCQKYSTITILFVRTLNVRTMLLVTNHYILTAVVSLSKDNSMQDKFLGNKAVVTKTEWLQTDCKWVLKRHCSAFEGSAAFNLRLDCHSSQENFPVETTSCYCAYQGLDDTNSSSSLSGLLVLCSLVEQLLSRQPSIFCSTLLQLLHQTLYLPLCVLWQPQT